MMEPIKGNRYMTNRHEELIPKYKNEPFHVLCVDKQSGVIHIEFMCPFLSREDDVHNLQFGEWDKYVNVTVEPQHNLNKFSFAN